jgi:hypothetical protein
MTKVPSDLSQAQGWRKSSFSGEKQDCVEVLDLPDGGFALRDSKDPNSPVLRFTASERAAFISGTKAGEFG